ncbi:putative quinol monooxygenase [Beijerinckia sp. L45]|uniref:putative quinol monooxygenase n=1 Tax=Beijerinckia sp. L45 TaxID=1641855 RepID=UPI00131C0D5C|nr:antibiotic biosynthesis monooxygenase [Beijerinckia sp. L45]
MIRRQAISRVGATVLALMLALAAGGRAQADQPITVVINVDVLPDRVADGKAMLRQDGQRSRGDAGFVSWQLLQRTDHDNHFAIIEAWRSMADFDRHVGSEYARATRDTLQPLLAAPFDERMFRAVD